MTAGTDPSGNEDSQFWFNTETGEVEEGRQSAWTNRMGPYSSRAEAQGALERARRKTAAWDAEDREWEDG